MIFLTSTSKNYKLSFGCSCDFILKVVTSVCGQIWGNLEKIADLSVTNDASLLLDQHQPTTSQQKSSSNNLPALGDYVLMQLEALGHILSYCLLETGQASSHITPTPHSSVPSSAHSTVASFIHLLDAAKFKKSTSNKDHVAAARQSLLSMMPRQVKFFL